MIKCPTSGLLLPTNLFEEKHSLKKSLEDLVEDACNQMQHLKEDYFLAIHAKFEADGNLYISAPVATMKLPPYVSNQFVYWISNKRGICELLWMVAPTKKGEKLQVEFNKKGVAYLQKKGAMNKTPKPS